MSLKLKIPPPLVGFACALIMWFISRIFDLFDFNLPARIYLAGGLFLIAIAIDVLALLKFRDSKTTINPMKPGHSSELVVSGIYTYTRNPMYLGLLIILSAWAVYLANLAVLLVLPVFVWYISKFQILPEEQMLVKIFGDKYIKYKQQVRRWI